MGWQLDSAILLLYCSVPIHEPTSPSIRAPGDSRSTGSTVAISYFILLTLFYIKKTCMCMCSCMHVHPSVTKHMSWCPCKDQKTSGGHYLLISTSVLRTEHSCRSQQLACLPTEPSWQPFSYLALKYLPQRLSLGKKQAEIYKFVAYFLDAWN